MSNTQFSHTSTLAFNTQLHLIFSTDEDDIEFTKGTKMEE